MEPRGCNWWQSTAIGQTRKRRKQAKTVAVRSDRLPREVQGKEGVDGSSPSEGSAKARKPASLISARLQTTRTFGIAHMFAAGGVSAG